MSLASWPTLFRGSMFDRDGERMAQADQLEQLDVASVFIGLESGHSNRTTVEHAKYVPSRFPDRYLVHVTHEKKISRQYAASAYFREELVVDDKMSILPLTVLLPLCRTVSDPSQIVLSWVFHLA